MLGVPNTWFSTKTAFLAGSKTSYETTVPSVNWVKYKVPDNIGHDLRPQRAAMMVWKWPFLPQSIGGRYLQIKRESFYVLHKEKPKWTASILFA